ncbi:MAG: cyclase family protein [Sphingomonadaceae bacterium]|nr:cyclase family protein [Sphingomonadaceae bacterium]
MKAVDFDKLAENLRNWGRWGKEDQRGTLNHIDPAALCRGAAEVRAGKMFNLGINFDRNGPQDGSFRINPMLYVTALDQIMNPEQPRSRFSDDVVHMSLQCATQWDALSHAHYDGALYNGFSADESLSTSGAANCGVEHLAKPGIASRGVLLDIAKLKGTDILSPDTEIMPDDLNAACEAEGVSIESGDIVMVRTGWIGKFTQDGRDSFNGLQPGLSPLCAEWLHQKNAATVCSDNIAVEIVNAEMIGGEMAMALHMFCLRDMGMPLGEMFDFDALAADCAADGQYTCMLAAPPLAITNAFGSPINPVALK